jgi:S1-C subfamily serine protease
MNSWGRGLFGAVVFGVSWAHAQVAAKPPASLQDEEAVIAENRKGAKPRPLAPGKPITPEDRERARVFNRSKNSVVYISSRTHEFKITDNRTGRAYDVPPGTGTGFVWDDLGHVVTNYHVVTIEDLDGVPRGEADDVTVALGDGRAYRARVIGKSLAYDIAVLHVFAPLKQMAPIPIGSSRALMVGQSVLAIGNPFGMAQHHTLTSGIVSGLGREMLTVYGTPILDVIQTDAAINPGNSGGPLLDRAGRLVGMNTAITSTSGSSAGIGFAIPVDTLNRVVPTLIEQGQQGRPELGFVVLGPSKTAEAGVERGLVVAEVIPGSHADRAGLRPWKFDSETALRRDLRLKVLEVGDVILGFQGKPLLNDLHLFVEMEVHPRGEPFELDVLRDGAVVKIYIDPWSASKKDPPKLEKTVA